MRKRILIISILLLVLQCKKNDENCREDFYALYLDRLSIWLAMDKYGITYNENFSENEYHELTRRQNDSLSFYIDCALEKNKEDRTLYLYKMKQLFLANRMHEVRIFFNSIDRGMVGKDIYFQLSLFNLLCQELESNRRPSEEYKKLLTLSYPHLSAVYKERGIEEFLEYLITDNIIVFRNQIISKYPEMENINITYEEDAKKEITRHWEFEDLDRLSILKDIMMRGDNIVFD